MKKFEIIWREILTQALEERKREFFQTQLARKFHVSTSTVFHALVKPRAIGAVKIGKKECALVDFDKLLLLWATERNLKRDIIYETHIDLPILEIEGLLPGDVLPTAYTSYRLQFDIVPADYDRVVVYASGLESIQKRFPPQKGRATLTVLQPDPFLASMKTVSLVQLYVDLWSLPQWYGRDFYLAVYQKIEEKLGTSV